MKNENIINTSNIVIWIIIPLIIILFTFEYLMICKLFSCRVFNLTTCDFVYVFSILSLLIEITRITPKMKQFNYYSLDEHDEEYHLDSSQYWIHKLFDSFIDFIIFMRIVHSILRTVLYYIYGQEYRQLSTQNESKKPKSKTKTNKFKHTYQQTATNENEDDNLSNTDIIVTSESEDETNENDIKEPEPIQPTIMDNCDTTDPLPIGVSLAPLHNKSVDLGTNDGYIGSPNSYKGQTDHLNKLKLNIDPTSPANNINGININMLSPPQVEVDPSDVDTQSIERIDYFPSFEPQKTQDIIHENDVQTNDIIIESQKKDATNNEIMHENICGDSWGIFPMFASKLGIVIDLCISLILLFDHRYLFILRIVIFGLTFIVLMYISSKHFIQFIQSFLESNQLQLNADNTIRSDIMPDIIQPKSNEDINIKLSDDNIINKDIERRVSEIIYNEPQMQITKQIKSIILNPNININDNMQQNNNIILNPWDMNNNNNNENEFGYGYGVGKDIEFRTGQDEIKGIVRAMLCGGNNDISMGMEMRDKLREILSILQDIDCMDKGNIEEKIDLDPELDIDTKRFLAQTLLSKHSMKDNYATPRFDFNNITSDNDCNNNKGILITPLTSHDTILQQTVSPPKVNDNKLNVLAAITPQQKHEEEIKDDDEIDEKYNENENEYEIDGPEEDKENEYEIDIQPIIDDIMNCDTIASEKTDYNYIWNKLQHISPLIDKLTLQILELDNSINIIELDRICGAPLLHTSICIFIKYDFANKCNISLTNFINFISFIEHSYLDEQYNPYHNRMHATEVMLATMIFVNCLDDNIREMITPLQIFTAFISAIIHDVDHPGNNNAFEINTDSNLAIMYSDQSVLEYHHLQYTFQALKKNKKNINFMCKWDKQIKKEFRKQVIYSVLATDLSKHFGTIAHIKQLKIIKENDLEYVFKSIIKMSDLSHVCKPLIQHKQWTQRITNEFHNQGDKELKCGLDVSPLCNKQNKKIAKGQVGFIKHVVSPLYNVAQRFFIKNSKFDKSILNQLNLNRLYWEKEAKKDENQSIEHTTSLNTNPTPASNKTNSIISPIKRIPKQRPLSATFATKKIAILTNLNGTPPPILPSSVRNVTSVNVRNMFKHSFINKNNKRFFTSPSNKSNKSRTDTDMGKGGGRNIHFSNYNNIKDKKRIRSSSANSLELPNFITTKNSINNNKSCDKINETLSDILTPTSLLRLGSNQSTKISPICGGRNVKSLTPKYMKMKTNSTKNIPSAISPNMIYYNKQFKKNRNNNNNNLETMFRTKSNDIVSSNDSGNKIISSSQIIKSKSDVLNNNNNNNNIPLHIISPKTFASPYSISHDVSSGLLSKNDNNNNNNEQQSHTINVLHEEKSSSDSQQRFKFNDNVIQESK